MKTWGRENLSRARASLRFALPCGCCLGKDRLVKRWFWKWRVTIVFYWGHVFCFWQNGSALSDFHRKTNNFTIVPSFSNQHRIPFFTVYIILFCPWEMTSFLRAYTMQHRWIILAIYILNLFLEQINMGKMMTIRSHLQKNLFCSTEK